MKLKAELVPYSSTVGGGLKFVDYKGKVMFQAAVFGSQNGITKEQSDEISQRLMDGFNGRYVEPISLAQLEKTIDEQNGQIKFAQPRAVEKVEPTWSAELPNAQSWYWWWNGDPDDACHPVSVFYSGCGDNYFVTAGQLGLKEAIDCDKFGGFWIRMYEPDTFVAAQQKKAGVSDV